jgi:anti-sigma-K factor RskA
VNIKEYISSGILELYVLGMLSEEESREVTHLVQKHRELQTEVDKIQQSLQAFAQNQSPAVTTGLEDKILSKVKQTPQADGPFSAMPQAKPEKGSGLRNIGFLLGAVAATAFCFALWFYSNAKTLSKALQEEKTALQTLQENCDDKDQTINQLSARLDVLLNPDNQRVPLAGTDNAPQALAAVFYNTNDQKAYLNIGNLSNPPEDRFYQLWALVDGVPVDMGEFEITINGDTSIIEVPYIANAGAFAITLEPRDGDPAPNLTELQVIGNVS